MKAKMTIAKELKVGDIDRRMFGSFVEHLGRAVYGGIYEPGHETADEDGFRTDVIKLVNELDVPIVRYPGGNFVSGYDWEDGVGPKDKRPQRLELAWGTTEPNTFGTNEFMKWCEKAKTAPMMAVNLGTRGPDEARALVEYCNLNTNTKYAQMRKEHGFEKPWDVKLWCLGNEMDGPWQICHLEAKDYARKACEAAKIMKWTDPSIELVACGSSSSGMPTFGEWEETVLRECYEHIDYISLHSYYGNRNDNTEEYLGSSIDMDQFIEKVVAICDKIKEEKGSDKDIHLSFDEWNVWFHSNEADKQIPRWSIAPPQLEDIYNMEDALVVGSLVNSLINHSDRVKIGCLAQLVNVIAPVMTVTGGKLWLQTTFYPYMYASRYGRGVALKAACECEKYAAGKWDAIPYVDCSAVYNEEAGEVAVFVVNRNMKESVTLDLSLTGFAVESVLEHKILNHDDMKATNSAESQTVTARDGNAKADSVDLEPHSYNMIRLKVM